MQILDNKFFEAYKCLDNLCSDIYSCRNGVSQYIEDLERMSYQERLAVSSWEQIYKTLKHLRWVRNRIAHDSGEIQICEEFDIQDVNDFYDDIMFGRDPLTQLRRCREHRTDVKKAVRHVKPATMSTVSDHSGTVRSDHRRTGCFSAAILLLAGAVAVIVYLLTTLL